MDGISMRPGCPVGYDELRYVTVRAKRLDGTSYDGELIVHRDSANDIVSVFELLYVIDYPVEKMRLVDDYGLDDNPANGGDDWASIEDNNTSAFNCRNRTGSTTTYSQHSYGTALDINPLWNPYVGSSGTTSHPASVPFLDRTNAHPGVIKRGDAVVQIFAAAGWEWGGDWTTPKDYQHFSLNGN